MVMVCIECFAAIDENARRLALQPLKDEHKCLDCGHSPARYSSNLMFALCDGCRSQQDQGFLSLAFLRPAPSHAPRPQSIHENRIFLGCQDCASNRDGISELGITAVLVCGNGLTMTFKGEQQLRYHLLPIDDSLDQNLIAYLPSAMAFIDEVLGQGGRVLVHCAAGISRSAAVCIAWVMKHHRWDYRTAHSFVKSCRRKVHPNDNFAQVLEERWQPTCCVVP